MAEWISADDDAFQHAHEPHHGNCAEPSGSQPRVWRKLDEAIVMPRKMQSSLQDYHLAGDGKQVVPEVSVTQCNVGGIYVLTDIIERSSVIRPRFSSTQSLPFLSIPVSYSPYKPNTIQ
jgi:hypothetical protein